MIKNNIYEFSDGFIKFTKPNVTCDDNIQEDENKFKMFLLDIKYDIGKSDKKSSRYRTIKRILGLKHDVFGKGLNSFDINPKNQGTCHVNDLIERLELLILETKAGHDGLYDQMLNISKQYIYYL